MTKALAGAMSGHYTNPYEDIRDKAGARLIIQSKDQLPDAIQLVDETFDVFDKIDKTAALIDNPERLGYMGFHFEVTMPSDCEAEHEGVRHDVSGLFCEIQVQTRAQNLWNDVSHKYLYKPSIKLPPELAHRLYRLVALMEIFDDELVSIRQYVSQIEGTDTFAILKLLEKHFEPMLPGEYDMDLSLQVLEVLADLLDPQEMAFFDARLEAFVAQHEARIEEILSQYTSIETVNPLISQPEVLLIFEQFEKDPFELRDRWNASLPPYLLENLANVWGARI